MKKYKVHFRESYTPRPACGARPEIDMPANTTTDPGEITCGRPACRRRRIARKRRR